MSVDRRLSVAPMMDCTDRHFRSLVRLVTRRTLLYTEMVPAAALVHGDASRFLGHDEAEWPLALPTIDLQAAPDAALPRSKWPRRVNAAKDYLRLVK